MWKFRTLSVALNGVRAAIVAPFVGKLNLAEGIWSTDGIRPMGAGLHEPEVTCAPLVRGVSGRVRAQKLM